MEEGTSEKSALLKNTGSRGGEASTRAPYHSMANSSPKKPGSPSSLHRRLSILDIADSITLSWRNIDAFAKPKSKGILRKCCGGGDNDTLQPPKQILKDVCGVVHPGTLLAIMGASGAGKSTLMNVLTSRNLDGLNVEGEILVNGENLGQAITNVSAYVQQDDNFIGTLKVKEHLWFQSLLKMDKSATKMDREYRVKEVASELGLLKCMDSIIGTQTLNVSISGGEKKRLSFASEILTNPALLFCDEPTSGLDSFMAMNVVQTLKNMAQRGKTILCTIHQPSSEVFALFDSVLLLAEGQVAFMGSSKDALEYFDSVGYPCPTNFNPADHYIYTLAIIPGKEQECQERVNSVCNSYKGTVQFTDMMEELQQTDPADDLATQVENLKSSPKYKAPILRQFHAVFWRSWLSMARDPMVFRARLIQSVATGLLLGLIYFRMPYDQKGVMNINGALFLVLVAASMGNIFAVINTFPLEYPTFLREHQDGMYRVSIYYLCKILAETPMFLFLPAVMVAIAYFMLGLYESLEAFLIATGCIVLVSNVAVSFGYVFSTMSTNLAVILALAPLLMTPLMMFGGFFLNSGSVPIYFVWLKYISWFNYGNEILVINQWRNVQNITCTPGKQGLCYPNGKAIIDALSYHEDHLVIDFVALIGLLVGFRLLSFTFLFIRSRRK